MVREQELTREIRDTREKLDGKKTSLNLERKNNVALMAKLNESNNRIKLLEGEISSCESNLEKYNKELRYLKQEALEKQFVFFDSFCRTLSGVLVDSDQNQLFRAVMDKPRDEKLQYIFNYLQNPDNVSIILNNDANRVTAIYQALSGDFTSPDKGVSSIKKMLEIVKNNKFKKPVTPKVSDPVVKVEEEVESESKTNQSTKDTITSSKSNGFSRQVGSVKPRGNAFFGKSRGRVSSRDLEIASRDTYYATVRNNKLKSIVYKNDEDSVFNILTARDFLGYSRLKNMTSETGDKVVLSYLPVHAVGFSNPQRGGKIDFLFGGVATDGCIAFKNIHQDLDGYDLSCHELNNTQLFNALYLATVVGGNYKGLAQKFFYDEYLSEISETGKEKFLFNRPEGYHQSPDNYFPTICKAEEGVICTGNHNDYDKDYKRSEILGIFKRFVDFVASNECGEDITDAKLKRSRDNILKNIYMFGWYNKTRQSGDPIVLVEDTSKLLIK